MSVPRQGESAAGGRVNQKQRTRAAIVAAGTELLAQGTTPTVAQAAEAAQVSRTTAYRYFPTQESLLVDLSLTVDVDDVERLANEPVDRDGAVARTLEVLDLFNQHVFADEVQYRTSLRFYVDLVLAQDADDLPASREGRRERWFATTLEPLRDSVPEADLQRLGRALGMLCGSEAMVVMRDVYGLDGDEARTVQRWAATTLIEATLAAADAGT